jgi:hypothetical protein
LDVVQRLGYQGIGVEYSPNRVCLAAAYTSTLLSKRGSVPALLYKVATAYGNIHDLLAFLPESVTIAYQYDEVFPLDVMEKLMVLYRMAPLSLRFMVGSKAFKQPSYGAFSVSMMIVYISTKWS